MQGTPSPSWGFSFTGVCVLQLRRPGAASSICGCCLGGAAVLPVPGVQLLCGGSVLGLGHVGGLAAQCYSNKQPGSLASAALGLLPGMPWLSWQQTPSATQDFLRVR